eukprot:TRINITY_DN20959_c0_g1_i1.p1 TRINITY_DN20959_c0_g1~~TRINITY_DN20959_c0_g1_i1.p1  ORF type:complete len:350 (-),score=30.32 TRINITY_DN20959_c0_g1_i1:401-1426(-)
MRILLFVLFGVVAGQIPLAGQKTIGTAIKGGNLLPTEQTVFEEKTDFGGVINYIWMTGADTDGTRMRIYVDGETTPSLDFDFYLAVGVGWVDESAPWNSDVMGKNAGNNAYLTYRIPFGKSIRITIALETHPHSAFWFICRGLAWGSAALVPANIEWGSGLYAVPSTARLRLYKTQHTLQPYTLVTLYEKNTTAGALWMVTIQANSTDLNFLEGCFRAYIDGAANPMFLSSGTEDFFNSAYYFNAGMFHSAMAGLTHKKQDGIHKEWRLGMYRTFDRDPLVFGKGLTLKWRNCEHTGTQPGDCPNKWMGSSTALPDGTGSHVANPEVAVMSFESYVWVYEW